MKNLITYFKVLVKVIFNCFKGKIVYLQITQCAVWVNSREMGIRLPGWIFDRILSNQIRRVGGHGLDGWKWNGFQPKNHGCSIKLHKGRWLKREGRPDFIVASI